MPEAGVDASELDGAGRRRDVRGHASCRNVDNLLTNYVCRAPGPWGGSQLDWWLFTSMGVRLQGCRGPFRSEFGILRSTPRAAHKNSGGKCGEISPYANPPRLWVNRRTKTVQKKKPSRSTRNDVRGSGQAAGGRNVNTKSRHEVPEGIRDANSAPVAWARWTRYADQWGCGVGAFIKSMNILLNLGRSKSIWIST